MYSNITLLRIAVGPPGWRSGLGHCIAVLAVPPETLGSSPGSVAAGRDWEVHGATVGISLSHHALATTVAGRARQPGRQVHGVSSDTLVRLASGLDARCVKKQCGLVWLCFGGRMAFDLRLSRTGVVAMRQDSNY